MIVLESAARTASGTEEFNISGGGIVERAKAILVQLDVTAAATAVDDVLAVVLQGTIDGTNYYDIGRFADVLGNGGAKRYIMSINRRSAVESELLTPTDGLIAAGTVLQGPFPNNLRIKYVITDAGDDNASFTFSVHVDVLR